MQITRVSWTPDAYAHLHKIRQSLYTSREPKASLPVRDLRLRLQVRDAGVMRVDRDLGQYKNPSLLVSTSSDIDAAQHANAAVAKWVQEAVYELRQIDKDSVASLRRLALAGAALEARQEFVEVFHWGQHRQSGTATNVTNTQFADLADYVANRLAGMIVYPDTTPLRRIVTGVLTANEARLITDPIAITSKDKELRFSLGITVHVDTFPGRSLPVIIVSHHKHVWARKPRKGAKSTTGYAFPKGESRAFAFDVDRVLSLGDDYRFIAQQYSLPTCVADAQALATEGRTSTFDRCPIHIGHLHGQAESDAAQRGVPEMDRILSFERMATILEPLGFRPWTVLREIPTHYKSQKDADGNWKHAFADADADANADADDVDSAEDIAKAEASLQDWVDKMRRGIDEHYEGTYHLVIGYADGYQRDAELAQSSLEQLLGEGTRIHLEALPPDVHGLQRNLPKPEGRAAERAQARVNAWLPFVRTMRSYMAQHEKRPVHGLLIVASQWYTGEKGRATEDKINKRVARITLNSELGLTVQYLLPARYKNDVDRTITPQYRRNFRMRLVNAWRDMAWKSIGKMRSLEQKVQRSLEEDLNTQSMPTLLGLGAIRTNQRRHQGNETCLIPYAIELDPSTGSCQAAVLLKRGDSEPHITPMLELRRLIKELTQNGPSHVARNVPKNAKRAEEARQTQLFLHKIIAERAKLHRDLIILADMQTLSGLWPWLADSKLDPTNLEFAGEAHAEQDFRDATIVRLRDGHAPKVLIDAPRVNVRIDGNVRPAANWSDANLYAIDDSGEKMPTYLSFGTRIFKARRGVSCYRSMETDEGKIMAPYLEAWSTPSALEITIIRTPQGRSPEGVAKLVEALRSEYEHYGAWTKYPAPLFFASFLKEYVPDYDLDDNDAEEDVDEDE